jgi:hypothetical protein
MKSLHPDVVTKPAASNLPYILACTRIGLGLLSGLGVTLSSLAQAPDTVQSPACRQALAEVQAQETAALNARNAKSPASAPAGPSPDALLAMRERAARICLGPGTTGPSPSQRTVQQPITVPPANSPRPTVTVPTAPTPTTTAPVVPLRSEPLLTVVSCDATACWASDGSRLEKSGPNLIGPRGVCTLQGAVLRCPQ